MTIAPRQRLERKGNDPNKGMYHRSICGFMVGAVILLFAVILYFIAHPTQTTDPPLSPAGNQTSPAGSPTPAPNH